MTPDGRNHHDMNLNAEEAGLEHIRETREAPLTAYLFADRTLTVHQTL